MNEIRSDKAVAMKRRIALAYLAPFFLRNNMNANTLTMVHKINIGKSGESYHPPDTIYNASKAMKTLSNAEQYLATLRFLSDSQNSLCRVQL